MNELIIKTDNDFEVESALSKKYRLVYAGVTKEMKDNINLFVSVFWSIKDSYNKFEETQ